MTTQLTLSQNLIDDITGVVAGVDEECGCFWFGLVSLMTILMVNIGSTEAMITRLKSVEFKGIKNPLKDQGHYWRFGGCWRFLTGADVLDHD